MTQRFAKPFEPDDQIYYLHVPKSAGTTFIQVLDQRFVDDEVFPVHYDMAKFRSYSDEDFDRFRFIRGHFPFPQVVKRLSTQPRCVTFFRDPVVRFLSNFEMRQRVADPLVGIQDAMRAHSLESFLDDSDLVERFCNRATRFFGGMKATDLGVAPDLDAAIARVERRFEFVGLVERFAESMALFAATFDLPPIRSVETLNQSPDVDRRSSIPDELLARVEEMNQLDVHLFDAAVARFESDLLNPPVPRPRDEAPPESVDLDMRRMQLGCGWYPGERVAPDRIVRWTGPSVEATIDLELSCDNDLEVRYRIAGSVSDKALADSQILCNGDEVETNIDTDARVIYAVVPALLLDRSGRFTTFTLRSGEMGERNGRALGLCVERVEIEPSSA